MPKKREKWQLYKLGIFL